MDPVGHQGIGATQVGRFTTPSLSKSEVEEGGEETGSRTKELQNHSTHLRGDLRDTGTTLDSSRLEDLVSVRRHVGNRPLMFNPVILHPTLCT